MTSDTPPTDFAPLLAKVKGGNGPVSAEDLASIHSAMTGYVLSPHYSRDRRRSAVAGLASGIGALGCLAVSGAAITLFYGAITGKGVWLEFSASLVSAVAFRVAWLKGCTLQSRLCAQLWGYKTLHEAVAQLNKNIVKTYSVDGDTSAGQGFSRGISALASMGLLVALFASVVYYVGFPPKPLPTPQAVEVAQTVKEMGYADVTAALAELKHLKATAGIAEKK
jgi:hypothetical protein